MAEEGENTAAEASPFPTVRLRWEGGDFHRDLISGGGLEHLIAAAQVCANFGAQTEYDQPARTGDLVVEIVFMPDGAIQLRASEGPVGFMRWASAAAILRADCEAQLRMPHIEEAARRIQAQAARSAILNA